jgi:hypothetical protein
MSTENHQPVTRDDLLTCLKEFARRKNRNWVSRSEFTKETGIPLKRILKFFVRWNSFVNEAGLQPLDRGGQPGIVKGYSRNELLDALREFVKIHGTDAISMGEFCKVTHISYKPIYRLFGNWNGFINEAGIKPHPMQKTRIPDELLLDDFLRVVQNRQGALPSYFEFEQLAQYSIGTYENRFGGFKGLRRQAVLRGIKLGILQPSVMPDETDENASRPGSSAANYEALDDRPVLGEEINVPGLVHAPVNEMGVVYLFGTMAESLGFRVESFNPLGFPDCEAKRRLPKGRWQRVRIEFEYRSSNFLQHKHDASKCDLIICWINDWKDSPIEVFCLKDIILKQNK